MAAEAAATSTSDTAGRAPAHTAVSSVASSALLSNGAHGSAPTARGATMVRRLASAAAGTPCSGIRNEWGWGGVGEGWVATSVVHALPQRTRYTLCTLPLRESAAASPACAAPPCAPPLCRTRPAALRGWWWWRKSRLHGRKVERKRRACVWCWQKLAKRRRSPPTLAPALSRVPPSLRVCIGRLVYTVGDIATHTARRQPGTRAPPGRRPGGRSPEAAWRETGRRAAGLPCLVERAGASLPLVKSVSLQLTHSVPHPTMATTRHISTFAP